MTQPTTATVSDQAPIFELKFYGCGHLYRVESVRAVYLVPNDMDSIVVVGGTHNRVKESIMRLTGLPMNNDGIMQEALLVDPRKYDVVPNPTSPSPAKGPREAEGPLVGDQQAESWSEVWKTLTALGIWEWHEAIPPEHQYLRGVDKAVNFIKHLAKRPPPSDPVQQVSGLKWGCRWVRKSDGHWDIISPRGLHFLMYGSVWGVETESSSVQNRGVWDQNQRDTAVAALNIAPPPPDYQPPSQPETGKENPRLDARAKALLDEVFPAKPPEQEPVVRCFRPKNKDGWWLDRTFDRLRFIDGKPEMVRADGCATSATASIANAEFWVANGDWLEVPDAPAPATGGGKEDIVARLRWMGGADAIIAADEIDRLRLALSAREVVGKRLLRISESLGTNSPSSRWVAFREALKELESLNSPSLGVGAPSQTKP